MDFRKGAIHLTSLFGAAMERMKFRSTLVGRAAAVVMIVVLAVLPCVHANDVEIPKQTRTPEEFAKYREAARAHFQKRCKENAGEKIHRTIEDVEGIFLAKPRKRPTELDLKDQHWMGDPYGIVLYPPAEISRYLSYLDDNDISTTKRTLRPGYAFVEVPSANGSEFIRHRLGGTRDKTASERSVVRQSRYAVIRDDISTREDRTYWVGGGRLAVVDLSTNEVLGERIGYVLEPGFGSTAGARRPWLFAEGVACPTIKRNVAIDRLFVQKILRPSRAPDTGHTTSVTKLWAKA